MTLSSALVRAASLLLGTISLVVWTVLAVWNGGRRGHDSLFNKRIGDEQHRLWSLAPDATTDRQIHHNFLYRRHGLQLHYLTPARQTANQRPNLIIFLHGFPDCCHIFTHFLASSALARRANLVALDLPGFGGSDGLPAYGPNEVLGLIANAIALLKVRHLAVPRGGCVLVGHDWGGVIASRLAMETKGLLDRVVIINAPVARLFTHNLRERISRCGRLLSSWAKSPGRRHRLDEAKHVIAPVLSQLLMSNYVFMFQLPISTHRAPFVVRFLLSKCHQFWIEDDPVRAAWAWASSMGPGAKECLRPDHGLAYGASVRERAVKYSFGDWDERTRLYREGLLTGRWTLDDGLERYAVPEGDLAEDRFPCPASIVFGKQDPALDHRICVQGVERYFCPEGGDDGMKSHVVLVDDCGHWSPLEDKGRHVITEHLLTLVKGPEWNEKP